MDEEDPTRSTRENIEGFVNVVEQARQDDCQTVVYAPTPRFRAASRTLHPKI